MKLTAGKNAPEVVNVFIEIPKGTSVKYELDKESGVLFVDRFSSTAMFYPANYGYVPETLSEDGDPVDVLVLSEQAVVPGVVIPSKPIGMLEMEDESGIDAKIIAVPAVTGDAYSIFNDLPDVPEILKAQIRHFFENYTSIDKGKWVKLKDWKGRETAIEEIRKGMGKK